MLSSRFLGKYLWYYLSGIKFDKLPSTSSTSPGFSKFALIQDMVWTDFSVSDLNFNYIEPRIIKFAKRPFKLIGDKIDCR